MTGRTRTRNRPGWPWGLAFALVGCGEAPGPGFAPADAGCMGGGCVDAPPADLGQGAGRCARVADCDDRVACTRDTCTVEAVCRHTPFDEMCPAGQRCDPVQGCTAGATPGMCSSSAQCDDRIDCTEDLCTSEGRCVSVAQNARCGAGRRCLAGMGCIADGACSSARDCDDGLRCNGAETCSELACSAGTPVSCDDNDPCTLDACAETGAMCTHTRDPSCMSSAVRSGFYNVTTNAPAMVCTALGLPALNFDIRAFQFVVSGSTLTVNGAPAPMTGSAPTGRSFMVSGQVAGDCVEIYSLSGSFPAGDDRRWTGTFSLRLVGLTCGLTNCMNRDWVIAATARD